MAQAELGYGSQDAKCNKKELPTSRNEEYALVLKVKGQFRYKMCIQVIS